MARSGITAARPGGPLWRHRDFNLLWAGQTVSEFGSQVSNVALPLIAVVTLGATPAQIGVLGFLARLPFLLYLFAGVWVDRVRRRPVLVTTDLLRGLLVLGIPLTAAAGLLRMEVLYATMLLVMILTVWFDTAYMTYLPTIVSREELVDGNTRLELSRSAAQIGGPGLGGVLVQAFTAPLTMLVDACSFLLSALLVSRIRTPEERPTATGDQPRVWAGIAEGCRFVFRHPQLRLLVIAAGIGNLAWAVQVSLFVLFASRGLGLPPALIGLVIAAGGPGALLGTLLAGRSLRWVGLGPTLIIALTVFGLASLLIPLAPAGRHGVAAAMLGTALLLQALAFQVSAINYLSLRQAMSPPRLLGRVNATFRFVGLGLSSLGALAGGALATALGLRPTLVVAALGLLVSPPMLLLSTVRRLKQPPPVVEEPEAAGG